MSRQNHVDGEPQGDPVKLPSIKAPQTPPVQESEHTRTIRPIVEHGHGAQLPDKPTAADRAWHSGERAAPTTAAPKAAAAASGDSTAESAQPTPAQASQAQQFKDQPGPKLAQLGMSEQQINTLAAAAVKEQTRFVGQGEAQGYCLSKDGSTIALRQVYPPLREFAVESALGRSERGHWAEVHAMGATSQMAALAPERAPQPLATPNTGAPSAARV